MNDDSQRPPRASTCMHTQAHVHSHAHMCTLTREKMHPLHTGKTEEKGERVEAVIDQLQSHSKMGNGNRMVK